MIDKNIIMFVCGAIGLVLTAFGGVGMLNSHAFGSSAGSSPRALWSLIVGALFIILTILFYVFLPNIL